MPMRLAEEPRLVAAAQSGDANAFSALVKQYYGKIYRLTIRITRNPEDAEDSVQEAMTKAYCNLGQFHGDSCFNTWLTRIAMNEALMNLRKRRSAKCVALEAVEGQRVATETPDPSDDPEARVAKIEVQESVSKALETLTPPLRTAFVLREVENLSVKETAETLRSSAAAVKSRLKRARSRLRRRLRKLAREDSSS